VGVLLTVLTVVFAVTLNRGLAVRGFVHDQGFEQAGKEHEPQSAQLACRSIASFYLSRQGVDSSREMKYKSDYYGFALDLVSTDAYCEQASRYLYRARPREPDPN